jgi:hypothetical protein
MLYALNDAQTSLAKVNLNTRSDERLVWRNGGSLVHSRLPDADHRADSTSRTRRRGRVGDHAGRQRLGCRWLLFGTIPGIPALSGWLLTALAALLAGYGLLKLRG